MAKCNSKNRSHKFQYGGLDNYSFGSNYNLNTNPRFQYNQQYTFDSNLDLMNQNKRANSLKINPSDYSVGQNGFGNNYEGIDNYSLLNNDSTSNPNTNDLGQGIKPTENDNNWANGLFWVGSIIQGWDASQDMLYNRETPLHEDRVFDEAMRGTAQDRHVTNMITDMLFTGNGLWGKSSQEAELEAGVKHARDINTDVFSNTKNNASLINTWDNNYVPSDLQITDSNSVRQVAAANAINPILEQKRKEYVENFYGQAIKNQQRQQRQAMMNYFDNGGSLDGLNGVTEFNVGGTHQENPYGGIQQGIASDNLPNLVEEGEVKWNDYIFSARSIPSESLLKKHKLI